MSIKVFLLHRKISAVISVTRDSSQYRPRINMNALYIYESRIMFADSAMTDLQQACNKSDTNSGFTRN